MTTLCNLDCLQCLKFEYCLNACTFCKYIYIYIYICMYIFVFNKEWCANHVFLVLRGVLVVLRRRSIVCCFKTWSTDILRSPCVLPTEVDVFWYKHILPFWTVNMEIIMKMLISYGCGMNCFVLMHCFKWPIFGIVFRNDVTWVIKKEGNTTSEFSRIT